MLNHPTDQPSDRVPLTPDMTLRDVAELLARRFCVDGMNNAALEVGLSDNQCHSKIAVRFLLECRPIESWDELMPGSKVLPLP